MKKPKSLGLYDIINFGRYKGKIVNNIIEFNPLYFKYRFAFINTEAQNKVMTILNHY